MTAATKRIVSVAGVVLATAVLVIMAAIALHDESALSALGAPASGPDAPPTVDFSWSPAGTVSLKEMRGMVTIHDDRGIDFSSYRMSILELGKTVDLPMGKSMIGRDYQQPISFGLLADDPHIGGLRQLTVRIEVADTAKQKTVIERTVSIKPEPTRIMIDNGAIDNALKHPAGPVK